MLLCVTEQIPHFLLSAGLEHLVNYLEPDKTSDAINSPNRDYTRLQLWLTHDLDLILASRAIPLQVKNSDEAKLVIRQG